MRRRRTAVITLTLVLALSACGDGSPTPSGLSVEEAKAIAQAGERLIAHQIPSDAVQSVDQQDTGTLLRCEGDRNYRLAGGTTVALVEGADVDTAMNSILALGERDGWTAQRETSAAGDPRAALAGPDDDGYIVDGFADTRQVDMSSISPCFRLPEDRSVFDEY